ncbi:MAG: TetR family transcriptional regulator C-terminal domain-containing protein [Pseudomonadota bacterium]
MAGIDSDAEEKGCLLVNTLLETPPEESEITRRAADGLRYVERRFVELLDTAKADGSLPPGFDSEGRARLLMTGIFGLRVYAKMAPPQGALQNTAEQLLKTLEQH